MSVAELANYPAVELPHLCYLAALELPAYVRKNQPLPSQCWRLSLSDQRSAYLLLPAQPGLSPEAWVLVDKLLGALKAKRDTEVALDWQASWVLVMGFELAASLWPATRSEQAWREFSAHHPETNTLIRVCDHPHQLLTEPTRKKAVWLALGTVLTNIS